MVVLFPSGHSCCLRGQRRPLPPAGRGASKDGGGAGIQRDGRQGAELTHLHLPHHPRRRGRAARRAKARGSAPVRQRRGTEASERAKMRPPGVMLLNTSLHHLTERGRRTPREGGGAPEGSQGQREAGGPLHPQSAGGDGGPLREAAHGPAAPAAAAPHAAAAAEPGLSAEPHVVGEALHCFQGVERVLALASSSLQRPLGAIFDAKIYIFSRFGATFCVL